MVNLFFSFAFLVAHSDAFFVLNTKSGNNFLESTIASCWTPIKRCHLKERGGQYGYSLSKLRSGVSNQETQQSQNMNLDATANYPERFIFSNAQREVNFGAYSAAGKSGGRLKENQDIYLVEKPMTGTDLNLFGVLDGHGEAGKEIAIFVAEQLPIAISRSLRRVDMPVGQAIAAAFLEVDRMVYAQLGGRDSDSGATATIVLHRGDTVLAASVGDSRAILGGAGPAGPPAAPLTRDHNPAAPRERARVRAAGGEVGRLPGEPGPPLDDPAAYAADGPPAADAAESLGKGRVFLAGRQYPGLATARAFGDRVAKTVGVSARPELRGAHLGGHGLALVIASDGLWEVVSPAEALASCAPAAAARDAGSAARRLVDLAADRWPRERSASTVDDITALVVFL